MTHSIDSDLDLLQRFKLTKREFDIIESAMMKQQLHHQYDLNDIDGAMDYLTIINKLCGLKEAIVK